MNVMKLVLYSGQVKVGADLTSAVIGTPYTIKLTIYDGCHDNKTANLYVYVFDDRPQSPGKTNILI